MKILYIHQYFKTPAEGGCVRSYHLAKGLVDLGHEVTLITGHNKLSGYKYVDGIDVHYLKIPYDNKFGFVRRIWSFLAYVIRVKQLIKKTGADYDLAYVMTTPLTTGFIAMHLKKKYQIPYYFEVGDLWPEAPIKIGAIKNQLLKKVLYDFERKCYSEAHKVIALSPAIRNYIESIAPKTKVHILPNFSDTEFFETNYKVQSFHAGNPLKVGYYGSFGAANELSYLIAVARLCEKHKLPVRFTLMGDGAQKPLILKAASMLNNVTVLPFGSSASVKDSMEQQDAVYISFKKLEILNTGSPNKFFDGLAAGKMIILNFGGWVRNLVDKHDLGFYHDPDWPEEFVRKIRLLLAKPEQLYVYQKNARALAETYYSKSLQVQKLDNILNNEKYLTLSDAGVCILTA